MPALLFQDPGIIVDQGIEHCIQVHMHEVEVILFVHAGNRVHGVIFRCEGVEKCAE